MIRSAAALAFVDEGLRGVDDVRRPHRGGAGRTIRPYVAPGPRLGHGDRADDGASTIDGSQRRHCSLLPYLRM
jgi:hypothetical protein